MKMSKMENAANQSQSKQRSNTEKGSNAQAGKPNQVSTVLLYGIPIVCLFIENQERLCLAQISNTLLKQFSYNEIHNRRVALGITCVQCTPVQLEILRRAGAMPVSSRRCGMITRREAERLCKSFLGDNAPPRLPDDFAFSVFHECAWGCRGSFLPSRYNSSRAKCIKCTYCGLFFSPNKFIFHSHRLGPNDKYVQPDAANFNSWRRHMKLLGTPPDEISYAWEDVKAMFNGGTRKRMISSPPRSSSVATPTPSKRAKTESDSSSHHQSSSPPSLHGATTATTPTSSIPFPVRPIIHPVAAHSNNAPATTRFPNDLASLPFPRWMDYMWHAQSKPIHFPPYALPRLKWPLFNASTTTNTAGGNESNNSSANTSPTAATTAPDSVKSLQFYNHSAFKPVINSAIKLSALEAGGTGTTYISDDEVEIRKSVELDENEQEYKRSTVIKESLSSDDEMVDIETTEDDIEDTRKELQRNCHENIEIGKRSVSPARLSPAMHSPTKIRADYKREQSPPVKLHTKYDGNSNVTSASIAITDNIPLPAPPSSSSPSQSPRSTTSSSPIHPTATSPGELWSVARLSLDRSQDHHSSSSSSQQQHHHHHHIHHAAAAAAAAARLPFYRNDLKHFHAFTHITGHNATEATTPTTTATRQGHSHTIV